MPEAFLATFWDTIGSGEGFCKDLWCQKTRVGDRGRGARVRAGWRVKSKDDDVDDDDSNNSNLLIYIALFNI